MVGINPNTQSLQGKAYDNLGARLAAFPTDLVESRPEDRKREVSRRKVDEMKASIEVMGLLSPIGVKSSPKGTDKLNTVIYGHHRFTAWKEKYDEAMAVLREAEEGDDKEAIKKAEVEVGRWQQILAFVYSEDMDPAWAERTALAENVTRNDLTPEERRAQAVSLGKLMTPSSLKLNDGGEQLSDGRGRKARKHPYNWARPWCEKTMTPWGTFKEWWNKYAEDCQVERSYSKALDIEIDGFLDWCEKGRNMNREQVKEAVDPIDEGAAKLVDHLCALSAEQGVQFVQDAVRKWWGLQEFPEGSRGKISFTSRKD